MTHMIGYAKISSLSQNLDAQIDNLKSAGCVRIFTDSCAYGIVYYTHTTYDMIVGSYLQLLHRSYNDNSTVLLGYVLSRLD